MYNRIKKKFAGIDMFSHKVELNINRQGNAHGTPGGGCVTIFLCTVYALYLGFLLNKMLNYDENKIYM